MVIELKRENMFYLILSFIEMKFNTEIISYVHIFVINAMCKNIRNLKKFMLYHITFTGGSAPHLLYQHKCKAKIKYQNLLNMYLLSIHKQY